MVVSAAACVGGWWASDLLEVTSDLGRLDGSGRWAVAVPYSGAPVLARFASWARTGAESARWSGPEQTAWSTSLDEYEYAATVEVVRSAIAAGEVYQANICRVMRAALPDPDRADVEGLFGLLAEQNPAPYGGFLRLPDHGVHIASASPELFLSVSDRDGRRIVTSGPIKGTGVHESDLTEKDAAENIMIVDLVRNDLSIISVPGSVAVPTLLQVQQHPGLVHLVSYVEGEIRPALGWPELLAATFPPGSVTGAPKIAAMSFISELEPASRSFYCGAFGWIDADTGRAELAVAIRTFWITDGALHFGTGAGITWGSVASAEWHETELKAQHLIAVASGSWPADPHESVLP